MALITFLIGIGVGILAALWYASAVAEAETPVAPTPDPPTGAGRYTVTLVNPGGQIRAVQSLSHLPKTIYRQRGKLASDVYRYDGVDSNGTHRFRLVVNGGH